VNKRTFFGCLGHKIGHAQEDGADEQGARRTPYCTVGVQGPEQACTSNGRRGTVFVYTTCPMRHLGDAASWGDLG
jgi:hypothetical protein